MRVGKWELKFNITLDMIFFKLLLARLFGILKGAMENYQKIQDKLNELNNAEESLKKSKDPFGVMDIRITPYRPWTEVPGYFSALKTSLNSDGSAAFFGDEGFVLKCFLNSDTGEVKFFPAKSFEI